MKILYIIDSLTSGGKERQLMELLKGLKNVSSITIKLVILSDNIYFDYIKDINVDYNIIKRNYKKDPIIFFKLFKICKDFRPDIIHSWELMCSVYSLPIAKILKIKFINGIIRNAPSINNISKRSLFYRKITYSFSDFILSNSYAGLRSYNSPRLKSICIYNGFDFNRIKNIKEKQNVINEHNIRTEKIVGMVARFHKSKDYYTYIMSGIKIIQKRNDVTFLAIGDGDTFKQCVELVPQKYNDNIRFLGNQKDVESIINIFDIGVLTTYTEGISNSIMEYMALGKPVVATKNEGNAEIVQDNRTGFLVTPRDISALTEKIDFLLNNNNIAINMGINGKKRLEKEFNLEKMTDAHIKIYEQCLRNSNRLNGIESI